MCIFKRKQKTKIVEPQLPWSEVVRIMRDKDLHYTDGYERLDTIYSLDGAHRYVILKSDVGYLTYKYEYLCPCDEDDYLYFPDGDPAYWQPHESGAKPIFDDMQLLMRELKSEPNYKAFFEPHE